MRPYSFTSFYPSAPIWVGSAVDFSDQRGKNWFFDRMSEATYSMETDKYSVKIARDGRIMIRIEALERTAKDTEFFLPIAEAIDKWVGYLNYLNAFYLLLDSSSVEVARCRHFDFHEITTRDVFRTSFEDGKFQGEVIASTSIASVFQRARYRSYYLEGESLQRSPLIEWRSIVPVEIFEHACALFAHVIASEELSVTLATFAKSVSEYRNGNYEVSIVLAWFIVEKIINRLWGTYIDGFNEVSGSEQKRITKKRREFLTGREVSAGLMSNLLELQGILSPAQLQEIDQVRNFRNKIVHGADFSPRNEEAGSAIKMARSMVERFLGIRITPNLSFSILPI